MPEASAKIVNRPAPPTRVAMSPVTAPPQGGPAPHTTTRLLHGAIGLGRLYRMGNGQIIELPSGMTAADAARLEADANTALKKLGKVPTPKPYPDLNKTADKSDKKAFEKVPLKGARGEGVTRGSLPKTAGLKAGLPDFGGKVAQYLIGKARPVFLQGVNMLARLSRNEQTHDNAAQKLAQSEKAVVIPVSENQSKSNHRQVSAVGLRAAPPVDEGKGKRALQDSLAENVPRNIEDVDNFKQQGKGQRIGADVLKVAQEDKNAVVSTYADMEHTPPPSPPEQTPVPLPSPEKAPGTPTLNLGQNAIAPLRPEHTDVGKYTHEADAKLKEEGITQEQLDMVDSGDLAGANKEKKGMTQMAASQPAAIQQTAKQETAKVDNELKQEEKKRRGDIASKRTAGLGSAGHKQKAAKSALEKKRDEVAATINGIYKSAQDKVKKRLDDLETQSMKRFDEGNAKASAEFENDVNRGIDAFKADRYSGWFGWARKAKDWLLGIDDLPKVKAIFESNRAAFVGKINQLVTSISADNKRVIRECKDELARAKEDIKAYVDKLGPALKGIGRKTAGEVNEQLEAMDGYIRKKEEDLQQKLADKQQAAIKAIDEKIEKMKEAMAGALAKLGKLLLWAAKKFFTWALSKFGYSLSEIEGIINKGATVLKAIFTKPIVFVKNLMSAAVDGFRNFGKNFLTHLKDALFEWLTGSLEGIKLPKTWNLQGIVSVALQIIGISYANIRKHMVDVMGEPVVAGLEKTFSLVRTLITEGPMAAWEQLKDLASDMKESFVTAVKDFIKQKIVEQAIQWVVGLLIPGAGIIKAVIGIYDTVVFLIQKAKQIARMIANFLGSIGDIAAGNIGAAAQAMEDGLARGLSLVVSFLAALLRLNGITAKIRDAIQKVRDKVNSALKKVANWIADKAKKLVSRVLGGDTNATPQQRLDQAMEEAFKAVSKYSGKVVGATVLRPLLATIRLRHRLTRLDVVLERGYWTLEGEVNPKKKLPTPVPGSGLAGFKSMVRYYNANGNRGATRMVADPIGRDFKSNGSKPSDSGAPPIWEKVNIRRNGSTQRLYVLGHLLNQRLGGTGDSPNNLTPISFSMNARHYSQVENHIVDNLGTDSKPRWYRYEVKVNYPSSRRSITPAETSKGVASEEGLLAKSFTCNWQELAEDASDPTKLVPKPGESPKSETAEHNIPPYPDT
jgi:DNA/RNA non-specific endonuclease